MRGRREAWDGMKRQGSVEEHEDIVEEWEDNVKREDGEDGQKECDDSEDDMEECDDGVKPKDSVEEHEDGRRNTKTAGGRRGRCEDSVEERGVRGRCGGMRDGKEESEGIVEECDDGRRKARTVWTV